MSVNKPKASFRRMALAKPLVAAITLTLCSLVAGRSAEEKTKAIELRIVPFSHLDLSWFGTQKEVESHFLQILTEALEKARANPDYRFLIDNVHALQKYMTLHREQLPLLKQLVARGQLEINPQWAIPHTTDNNGEGVVRNILYAKKFAKEEFGVDANIVSFTDLPERMVQTPQILRGLGIDLAVLSRPDPPGVPLLQWQGLDGSRILTANIEYGGNSLITHGITVDAPTMKLAGFTEFIRKAAEPFKTSPAVSTLGGDLFRPIENLDTTIKQWNAQSADVKIRLSTFKEYYEQVKLRSDLPVVSGEVPDAWVAYREALFAKSSQHELTVSNLLLTAEKLATASRLVGSLHYPGAAIAEAWKWLARSADHNYVGRGGREADEVKYELREKARLVARDIIDDSLSFIAEKVTIPAEPCVPIVVFNPLSWQRTDLVDAHLTFYPDNASFRKIDWAAYPGEQAAQARGKALGQALDGWPIAKSDMLVLRDGTGKQVDFQQIPARGQGEKIELYLMFLAEDVPPLGYKTFYLHPTKQEPPATTTIRAAGGLLENQYLRVNIDQASGAFSLSDKATGKTIVNGATADVGNYTDPSAYKAGKPPTPLPVKLERMEILESGPVRARIRVIYSVKHPGIQGLFTDLSLTRRNQLDIETTVKYDDAEVKDVLLVSQLFPVSLGNPEFHYGVPYGHNGMTDIRPGLMNDYSHPSDPAFMPLEKYRISRVVQQWLDIGGEGARFTIASSRRLFELKEESARCLLLGVPPFNPLWSEVLHSGKVVSRFTITPHSGTWQEAKTYRSGWETNTPLVPYTVQNNVGERTLPASLSFLSSSLDHAVVTVLKPAEEGDGIIVRMFEAEGREGKTALTLFQPAREAYEVNLLEKKPGAVSLNNVTLRKNEIKTVKLILKK